MEELESERSRLEQEKQALEMQMERLTLQVGDGMYTVQPLLLPASVNETPDFLLSLYPYLTETHHLSGSLSRALLMPLAFLLFCSLWCCRPTLPFPCGHDLHCCLLWTVSF